MGSSSSLVVRGNQAVSRRLRQELALNAHSMDEVVQLTRVALQEFRGVNVYAVNKAIATVKRAEQMRRKAQAKGKLTPEKQQQLDDLTKAYLVEVALIAHQAGIDIANVVGRVRACNSKLLLSGG